tara:strand:+ start:226 stop:813 length:588 start_codon:yes stop_codon:yes gene_type:complete
MNWLQSNFLNISYDNNFLGEAKERPVNMLEAKLWRNPCPFTFRINYLALLYNTPLYKLVRKNYDLKRPEYVVLFSLALSEGGSASEVSNTSGFPKNTLSRAINILETRGFLVKKMNSSEDGRKQSLYLSKSGWEIINETLPIFEEQEKRMLNSLTLGERQILFELLSKVVLGAQEWAQNLPSKDKLNIKDSLDES